MSIPSFKAYSQDETPAQLLQTVQTSLVEVRAVTGPYHAQGSGVILDSYGTIVTNTHILANAEHIFVGLSDGKKLEARLVYSSIADFSFIKIDPPYPLDPIRWADSSAASIGTPIISLSYTDDDHQRILGGEITNLIDGTSSNNVELIELNLNLMQGDSGGPLLDIQGHLLGLIMAKRKNEDNKTYAIASNKIQQEYSQYQQHLR